MKYFALLFLITISYCCKCQHFTTITGKNQAKIVSTALIDTSERKFEESPSIAQLVPTEEYLKLGSAAFAMPLTQLQVTSNYGKRFHPIYHRIMLHNGIDLAANSDSVYSIMPGIISKAGYSPSLGYFIEVDHENSFTSVYGHLSQILVRVKDWVAGGESIGITGSTGISNGEHLHFIVKYHKTAINPKPILELLAIKKKDKILKRSSYHGYSVEYLQAARQMKKLQKLKLQICFYLK